jgi:hypothetical protein
VLIFSSVKSLLYSPSVPKCLSFFSTKNKLKGDKHLGTERVIFFNALSSLNDYMFHKLVLSITFKINSFEI